MDESLSKILNGVYELEGLLHVMEQHSGDVPSTVKASLRDKAASVHGAILTLLNNDEQGNRAEHSAYAPQPAAAPPEQPASNAAAAGGDESTRHTHGISLPSDDYDADDNWQHEHGEEFAETFDVSDYHEPPHRTPPAVPTPVATQQAAAPSIASNASTDLRVDEQLQRAMSKDLRQAFSINDRYRFRRELFSNSDVEMQDALNMIESMKSFDEAEDYFYGDLGWDRNSDEAADFMAIIKNHFMP